MSRLTYSCIRCGSCCSNVNNGEYSKRIPLYPNEVDLLIDFIEKEKSTELANKFKVIEDLVFPDFKNKKILVVTYKFLLSNLKTCPFYSNQFGCKVQEFKPLACLAFPLAIKNIDAFNIQISIDPECLFVKNNYDVLANSDVSRLKSIFGKQYLYAEEFLDKNKRIILYLKKLEQEQAISIPKKITHEQLDLALKNWERMEIRIE